MFHVVFAHLMSSAERKSRTGGEFLSSVGCVVGRACVEVRACDEREGCWQWICEGPQTLHVNLVVTIFQTSSGLVLDVVQWLTGPKLA